MFYSTEGPRIVYLKSLKQTWEKVLWILVPDSLLQVAFRIHEQAKVGARSCVELDPNILLWQCDLTSVESPTLHESFRNFTDACFPPKNKGAHIHWETPPFRDPKSRTPLQAQSTKMLDSNCSRESQHIYFTVEAQARWNCTPLRQVSYKPQNREKEVGGK